MSARARVVRSVFLVSNHSYVFCAQLSTEAIASAKFAWDAAVQLGFSLRLLDLGGGFCGEHDMDGLALAPVAEAVNAALDEHFPPAMDVQIIAEPGRYFAEACATLVTNVYGNRQRDVVESGKTKVRAALRR